MHIEINQSLQKVAANRTREYLSEEIDWVINKMQHRFIQLKVKPKDNGGYSLEQLDEDALRALKVSGKKLPMYVDTTKRYKAYLPANYAYLISDASYVSQVCGGEVAEDEDAKLYITWLKLLKTAKGGPKFYETVHVTANADVVSVPLALPYFNKYVGYNRKEDITFLSPWIIDFFQKMEKLEVGYEFYGEYYKASHYFFISTTAQPVTSLVQDGLNNTVQVTEVKEFKQAKSLVTEQLISNRLESSENIHDMLKTAFYKPTYRSPISELSKNILYVYHDDSFTVNSCEITYIRKPRIVSLSLGSDCELAPDFHNTICDLATEYIKGRLENGQPIIERDNDKRVVI